MHNEIKPNQWDYPAVATVSGGLVLLLGIGVGVLLTLTWQAILP